MSKFSEFVTEGKKEVKKEDISGLVDKYSSYSPDQLMQEFLTASAEKKERGELDSAELEKVKSVLAPYLTPEQTKRLNDLLNMIK